METIQQISPPPAYESTSTDDLKLPAVPKHDIGPSNPPADLTLPGFKDVVAGIPSHAEQSQTKPFVWAQAKKSKHDGQEMMTTGEEVTSRQRSSSIASLDDPVVRMAAEALSGLGKKDSRKSSLSQKTSVPAQSQATPPQPQEEPLLALVVQVHPWVAGTINKSLSAYETTKNFTPRFVREGASVLERNMVNTVSSVGRKTGVEGGIRRYLDSRRASDLEKCDPQNLARARSRHVEHGDGMDIDEDSAIVDEQLPPYRDSKPPSYREESSPVSQTRLQSTTEHNRSWSSNLIHSTSGLGIALSDSSLKSLRFCVDLLVRATAHIKTVLNALKMVLQDYEKTQEDRVKEAARHAKDVEAGIIPQSQALFDEEARKLTDRIEQLCGDIWDTLKTVVKTVSTYTGGALPENARTLVKGQILSIPQRWKRASESAAQHDHEIDSHAQSGTSYEVDATKRTAKRMIAFAQEGLDVMAQVNGVVKLTLEKAEEWLATLGRKPVTDPFGDVTGHDTQGTAASEPSDDVMQ